MVPVELLHDPSGRHPSIRGRFHRDVLHPAVPVDGQLLLRVRLPPAGVRDPHCHVRRHRYGVLLLPALRGGLQLVSYTGLACCVAGWVERSCTKAIAIVGRAV